MERRMNSENNKLNLNTKTFPNERKPKELKKKTRNIKNPTNGTDRISVENHNEVRCVWCGRWCCAQFRVSKEKKYNLPAYFDCLFVHCNLLF